MQGARPDLFAGQGFGHGLLERLALEISGNQPAVGSDQERLVGALGP